MAADGASVSSAEEHGAHADPPRMADQRARRARSRFARIALFAYAVAAGIQVIPAVGLLRVAPPVVVVPAALLGAVLTIGCLRGVFREGRKPRWRIALVDTPLLLHLSAGLFALVLFPVALLLVGMLRVAAVNVASPVETAALAGYGASVLVALYGCLFRRRSVHTIHVDIPVSGLPRELDGYRVLQVSDLHIGNFDSRERGLAWAARVNALGADAVAVTGDLVTAGTAFYEDVADVIGAMRAKDGVFVSMGNHDQTDPDQLTRLIGERGSVVLRNAFRVVRRGRAELVIAGVDDRMTRKDDLDRTLAGRPEGAPTVLLAHYPEFFHEAAERGVDLVLSGHTHGGQVAMPFAARRISLSRLARQTAAGLHIRDRTRLYVNAGLGTTGPPVRLGAAPEITVLVLRRA